LIDCVFEFAFSDVTLLVGWQKAHLAHMNCYKTPWDGTVSVTGRGTTQGTMWVRTTKSLGLPVLLGCSVQGW